VETETKKIIVVGILATLLLLTMLPMSVSQSEAGTWISVEPPEKIRYLGNTFQTNITVWNISDFWSVQLNITWTSGILNCTDDNLDQTMNALWGINRWLAWPLTKEERINNTIGVYKVAVTAKNTTQPPYTEPFSGNATLLKLNYTAIDIGQTNINFSNIGEYKTILGNVDDEPIIHTQYNGTVEIRIPGDIVLPIGLVDANDLQKLGKAYNSTETSSGWLALADINDDGDVDANDLVIISENYGHTV